MVLARKLLVGYALVGRAGKVWENLLLFCGRLIMKILREGQVIRGTYEVERVLGEGAFGTVYRVRHKFLGQQSMKVFKAVGMTAPEIGQLMEEAVTLSKLQHRNIIRVFDADTIESKHVEDAEDLPAHVFPVAEASRQDPK